MPRGPHWGAYYSNCAVIGHFTCQTAYVTGSSGMSYCNQTLLLWEGGIWARDYTIGGIGSVPSEEVSQFGGFKYISGRCATPYLCCWVLQRHIPELSAFQRSPLLYTGEKGWLETSNMCTSLIVMSSLLNQSSAPENLVREACQCLHYPVNFIQSTICRYIHVAS